MFTESEGFPLNSDWLASNSCTLAWGGFCWIWSNPSQLDGNSSAERVPALQRSHRRDSLLKSGLLRLRRRLWMTLNIASSWRGKGTSNWPGNLTPPFLLLFVCLFVCLGFFSPSNHTGFWRNNTWRRPVDENTPDSYFLLSACPQFAFNSLLI